MLFPNQKLMIFPIPFFIPARVGVFLIGALSLLSGMTGFMPGVAHFAHLGGMLTRWLILRYWRGQPPFGRGGGRKPPQLRRVM
jgi:membrane associated rhomboid family serine protease